MVELRESERERERERERDYFVVMVCVLDDKVIDTKSSSFLIVHRSQIVRLILRLRHGSV